MKYAKHTLMAAGLAALVWPASAIEAPPDNAPRIAAPEGRVEEAPARVQGKAAVEAIPVEGKTGYLGIGGAPVPDMLAVHLGLKPGEGVWVRVLDPEGPATKAGFVNNDIILKIDGQAVGSQNDLTAQISGKKPGDEVSIDFIHAGKTDTRKVTLGERSANAVGMNLRNAPLERMLQGMPQDQAKRLRDSIEKSLGAAQNMQDLQADGAPEMNQAVQEMRKRIEKMLQNAAEDHDGGGAKFNMSTESTIRLLDQKGSVEIKNKDGSKQVKVLDKEGNVTWSGPWETDQDKAAAPADVKERIDALNLDTTFKGNGIRLKMGPRGFAGGVDPLLDE